VADAPWDEDAEGEAEPAFAAPFELLPQAVRASKPAKVRTLKDDFNIEENLQ